MLFGFQPRPTILTSCASFKEAARETAPDAPYYAAAVQNAEISALYEELTALRDIGSEKWLLAGQEQGGEIEVYESKNKTAIDRLVRAWAQLSAAFHAERPEVIGLFDTGGSKTDTKFHGHYGAFALLSTTPTTEFLLDVVGIANADSCEAEMEDLRDIPQFSLLPGQALVMNSKPVVGDPSRVFSFVHKPGDGKRLTLNSVSGLKNRDPHADPKGSPLILTKPRAFA